MEYLTTILFLVFIFYMFVNRKHQRLSEEIINEQSELIEILLIKNKDLVKIAKYFKQNNESN